MAKNQYSIVLEQNKLDGKNYQDWFRNLKIVLDSEHKTYVLDGPPPEEAPEDNTEAEIETDRKWKEDDVQARCLMLVSMTPQLQRQHELMQHASEIHQHLKDLFQVADRSLRYLADCSTAEVNKIYNRVKTRVVLKGLAEGFVN